MGRTGWGLYLDLPVGSRPDGFDATRHASEFAGGASIGAPPDMFFTKGQSWGFPPPHPQRMREAGYASLREALGEAMRHAGVLRIDHVLGLHRLYWVPHGHSAADGVYVRYHADEMYAIICLESRRNGTIVVGEDLGTVPPEVRESMARHGFLRSFGWQFEATVRDPLPTPPALSVASLNTHDARPFAAWWQGLDIDAQHRLGLITRDQARQGHADRARLRQAVRERLGIPSQAASAGRQGRAPATGTDGAADPRAASGGRRVASDGPDVLSHLLAWLDASPAALVLVNMEDLWGETQPVNDPADPAAPNWRRRHAFPLAQASRDPMVAQRLRALRRRSA